MNVFQNIETYFWIQIVASVVILGSDTLWIDIGIGKIRLDVFITPA